MTSDLGSSTQKRIQRGNFQIFPELRLILRDGKRLELSGKPFDIVLTLIEANNAVVAKDELLRRIWPNQIVEENNLQAHISAIRRALGADRGRLKTEFGNGYRLELPGEPIEAIDPTPAQFQVPFAATPLFGRHKELDSLHQMIEANPLVTITGIGGIGKTRLAIELAHRSREAFGTNIFFVELSSLTSAELVLPTIAAKIKIDLKSPASGEKPSPEAIIQNRTLLILDGCEHLLHSVAQAVEFLIRRASSVVVVTTSQEPLHIDGEQVFRLQPLALPSDNVVSIKQAAQFASAELLISRVKSVDHNFSFLDSDVGDICKVCRQLDGIPLALELAGSRVPLVGLGAVVSGLSDRFKLLTAGRRTAMPRHQTLRATLEWSYELLNASEQQLLNRLGVFAGAFTLASATVVAAVSEVDGISITDMMSSLVAKSLVSRDTGSRHRFYLFESMRAFALEKLISTGELATLAKRHAEYFKGRLSTASEDWQSMALNDWLVEYKDDANDVRAALDASFSKPEDVSVSAELICDSLPFWMQLSLLDECRVRVAGVLDRLKAEGEIPAQLEMRLQRALGAASAWAQGPTREVAVSWNRTLALADRRQDVEHQMQGHYGLWLYHLRSGNYEDSYKHGEALFALGHTSNDVKAKWTGERIKGVSLHFLGDNLTAKTHFESVLAGHDYSPRRSFPLRFGVDQRIAGFSFFARTLWLLGDASGAREAAEIAIAEAEELDHVSSLCCALLEGACSLWAIAEQWDRLADISDRAVKIADRYNLGFWRSYAETFAALARAKRYPSASNTRYLQSSELNLRRIGVHPGYSVFVSSVAQLKAQQGDRQGALSTADTLIASIQSERHWGKAIFLRLKDQLKKHGT